jgi:hypothetical protein
VLRAVKRSKKPSVGRALRLAPTRRTKDGAFLTALVEEGLLERVTGVPTAPFEATYALTKRGKHAAEYGEYEYELKPRPAAPPPKRPKKR